MSIEVIIDESEASLAVRPSYGKPVTFVVTERTLNVAKATGSYWSSRMASRFVVGLKGSTGHGFSHHTSFERACRSALYRARRYDRAYSVPRQARAA